MPSPVAVPPPAWIVSRPSRTATRSMVGVCSTEAVEENATRPTRIFSGTASRNWLAAPRAALMRSGSTSRAAIEPEVSVTSMIEARSRGTENVASGRASAKASTSSERSSSAGGTWRRQPGEGGATEASVARLAKRSAASRRRCWKLT